MPLISFSQPFGEEEVLPFGIEEAGTGELEFSNGFDFADPDGDGDLDLFLYYQDSNQILFYENKPMDGRPQYGGYSVNPFNIEVPQTGFLTFHSFVLEDIDGDQDVDILMGDLLRPFVLIENIGTPKTPNYSAPVSNDFFLKDCSLRPHAFGDIDSDGDIDVLTTVYLGGKDSKICLVQNEGTALEPDFLLPGDMSQLGQGNMELGNGDFADFDLDGDADYLQAEVDGNLSFHENISDGNKIEFLPESVNPWGFEKSAENNSTPRLVDIDNDGDLDYFELDLFTGQLFFRENLQKTSIAKEYKTIVTTFELYPNPADRFMTLEAELSTSSSFVQIYLRDLNGKIYHWTSLQNPSMHIELKIDLSKLTAGTYFLELQTEQGSYTHSLVKSF